MILTARPSCPISVLGSEGLSVGSDSPSSYSQPCASSQWSNNSLFRLWAVLGEYTRLPSFNAQFIFSAHASELLLHFFPFFPCSQAYSTHYTRECHLQYYRVRHYTIIITFNAKIPITPHPPKFQGKHMEGKEERRKGEGRERGKERKQETIRN